MNETQTTEQYLGYRSFYLERSGENARAMVEKLVAPPELPLSPEDYEKAIAFEHGLFNTYVMPNEAVHEILRQSYDETTEAPLFFAGAFIRGAIELDETKDQVRLPTFTTHQEVYRWLARSVHDESLSPETMRELAMKSQDYYKQVIVPALVEGRPLPQSATEAMPIVIDPVRLADTIHSHAELRRYLLELRTIYKEGMERLDGAKRAIVDVYLAKADATIASLIPVADYLLEQSKLLGNDISTVMALSLIPEGLREAMQNSEQKQRLLQRLDYLRNGIGVKDGRASPLSDLLVGQESDAGEGALFTPEQTQRLKETMIDKNQIREIFEGILMQAGKLSSEDPSSWTSSRSTRAADGLYQVVENPGKNSFAVDGKSGVFKTPFQPRSLYDVMTVGRHELAHINQAEADNLVAESLSVASLKGKRVSGLREAGANVMQRRAELEWFGRTKPIALTYAKALETLKEGGGIAEAAKAFYEEKRRIDPSVSFEAAAKEASDRVLRLVRKGGISSQALAYAEEGIMADSLAGAGTNVITRAIAMTSFDLQDQVRLHKYGLLPKPPDQVGPDWSQLILENMEPYVARALGTSK